MAVKVPKTAGVKLTATAEVDEARRRVTRKAAAVVTPSPEPKPMKALPAAPEVSERDLYFSTAGGFHWEPDAVLRIIAHEWRDSADLLPWTPAQLQERLGRSLEVPRDVLGRAARKMRTQPNKLEAYLSARPWDLERRLPPAQLRDVEDNHRILSHSFPWGGQEFELQRGVDLDEAIFASGLSGDQLSLMMHHSRGLFEVEDFLARAPELNAGHAGRDGWGGYALGITTMADKASLRFAYQTRFRFWSHGYERDLLGAQATHLNTKPQTERYMDLLTATNEPVAFLVPDGIGTWPHHSVTKQELDWLFENPHRMKNVHFVFGAYEQ